MIPSTPASLYIGVDGGGTHTRAVAQDPSGRTMGTGSSLGCNPNNIGFLQAAINILEAIEATGVTLDENASLCLGIAGLATPQLTEKLRTELLATHPPLASAKLHLTHDLEIAHYAAFRAGPGIVLIAGTGSACFAKSRDGQTYRASGRDFSYEDPGSGYAIGKRAIDNRLLPNTDSRASIAAFAPRVIELATEGDPIALDILRLESQHLAALAKRLYDDYLSTDPNPIFALSGSILTHASLYRDAVHRALRSALPCIEFIDVTTPPAQAAAAIAKSLA